MNTRSLFSYWHFNIALLIFIGLLCMLYAYITYFKASKKSIYLIAALVLIIICAASPLHFIGENYLFSAHMVSHIILLLMAGPLLVAAIPEENRFKKQLLAFSKKLQRYPFLSWVIGVGIMWLWHIPAVFNSLFAMPAITSHGHHSMSPLMNIHMLSLLISGMLFCWPVICPHRHYRISPVTGVLYLASACVFCSLLGLIITFAPAGTYTHHIDAHDMYGYLPVIRHSWNISAADDQQAGGLIMWVPCCFVYLTASMVLLIGWLSDKKKDVSINQPLQEYER